MERVRRGASERFTLKPWRRAPASTRRSSSAPVCVDPVKALLGRRPQELDDLLDRESLPGSPDLRVRQHIRAIRETEQRVEDAGVRDVDLRRPHLALPDVLEPRLELANDEDGSEQVQVPPHGGVGDTEGPSELGAVPDLPVAVLRSIGIMRARAHIGLRNLAYNMRRLTHLEAVASATG